MVTDNSTVQFSLFHSFEAAASVGPAVYSSGVENDRIWGTVHEFGAAGSDKAVRYACGEVLYEAQQSTQENCEVLVTLWFDVPSVRADEFEDWYRAEHGPMLLMEPMWLRVRLVKVLSSSRVVSHLVIHELADTSALASEALRAARETPRRARFAREEWFSGNTTEAFSRCRKDDV